MMTGITEVSNLIAAVSVVSENARRITPMADEGFQKAGMSNGSGVGIVLFYVIQKDEVYLGGYDRTTLANSPGRSV